ncbi:RagB/SusD family nutrient uptake outer membrane protein [Sphingobacterium pedocola]|uniref:RagB/SusD family nutrient uptake outer membrane protein n=1 Tax=Sphingobacterium pedocola TaxID=2082722 RepID=A0ABR9T6Y5_9SPHI|nr:RagB/SusD family nutrient uptake outer membrane protein [Sphingobacterium pedocola]MBE8721108.1 RagB/SusD family nutrient uptake outer membrane protein [Sphingobacterium pedocola]
MNRILKYLLLLSSFTYMSCDKFLEVDVPDNLVHDEYWQNREQVLASRNGMYSALHNNLNLFHVWGDIRSSLYTPGPGTSFSGDYRQFMVHDIYPTNGLVRWASVYTGITWINSFIKNAPSALEKDQTFKESELSTMMGEAHALRALNYFYLVRAFKEVPIIEDPYESDTQKFNTAAHTEVEVLDFIESDLEKALATVNADFENVNDRYGRITKNTVLAIWADVKLWRNEYQACLDLTSQLSAYRSRLLEPLDWFSIFSPGNSSESIFEYQYLQTGFSSPVYGWFGHFQPTSSGAKYMANSTNIGVNGSEIYPPTDLINWSADTIRLKDFSSYRMASVPYSGGSGFEVYKMVGQTPYIGNYRPSGSRNMNYIFYRYREILFMEAEALAMLGRYEEAEERINLVRFHCDIPEMMPGAMGTEVEFMRYLLMEREFELGFEGKEWFAAARVARRPGYQEVLIEKSAENNALGIQYQVVKARLLNQDGWFLPYHETELENNRSLVQKDFYKNK